MCGTITYCYQGTVIPGRYVSTTYFIRAYRILLFHIRFGCFYVKYYFMVYISESIIVFIYNLSSIIFILLFINLYNCHRCSLRS